MKKLKYLFEEITASFWFVPILMLSITIGSAIGLMAVWRGQPCGTYKADAG